MEPKIQQFDVAQRHSRLSLSHRLTAPEPAFPLEDLPKKITEHAVSDNNKRLETANNVAKALGATVGLGYKQPQVRKPVEENTREVNTANHALQGTTIKELEEMAEKGNPTEVSGDALARVSAGLTPRLDFNVEDATFRSEPVKRVYKWADRNSSITATAIPRNKQ